MPVIKTTLGLQTASKTRIRAWEGLVARKPASYTCIVFIVALVTVAYWFRTGTIFACPADGYSSDRYLAYCGGTHYADYEHGAFYFDLEPRVQKFASNTDVLFLGNSRLQIGFSTSATADWFSSAAARYYLMGFLYYENATFAKKLLRIIHPLARVYVINLDDFFDQSQSPPVETILHDRDARQQYEVKRRWQPVHETICRRFPALCGHQFVVFRSRETGAYHFEGEAALHEKSTPVSYDQAISQNLVNSNMTVGIHFLSHLPVPRQCVILTMVPYVGTKIGDAQAIAAGLGMKLVTPGTLHGLWTFDGYHLDRPSAQRWSRAFFQVAGPEIRTCLEKVGVEHP
jgi:hypothetical protein